MTDASRNGVTRRGLLGGLGVGAGVAGLSAMGTAQAALLPEPETSESYDVVIIGSGMAGCAAALEALHQGASVIVLEKASQNRMGGNSLLAGGGFCLPAEDTDAARQAFVDEFDRVTLGRGNSEIHALMAAHARENLAWLEANGIEVVMPEASGNPVLMAVAAPALSAGMPRAFRVLRERIPELGGVLAFDTKARQLIMNDRGAVAGVRAMGRDGLVDYRAGAVIVATGGFTANTTLMEAYSHPEAGGLKFAGVPHVTGDGLLMAQAAGAGLMGMGGQDALLVWAAHPVEVSAGTVGGALAHAVSIDRGGRRFTDESRGSYPFGRAVIEQPEHTVSLVFDQAAREVAAVANIIATYERLGIEVVEAATLEELAERIEVPAEALVETIEAFNAAVEDGAAPDAVPPRAASARRIETAPFYALHPVTAVAVETFGGIAIDGRARVLEPDGRVIPGLFAAGEGAGAVFWQGYVGGGALMNCLVMGRIAGHEAAALADAESRAA